MNRFKRAAVERRMVNAPLSVGFDEKSYEERAKIARSQMAKVDLMPPEYRVLVHEYGYKVRAMMRDGMTAEQIRQDLGKR